MEVTESRYALEAQDMFLLVIITVELVQHLNLDISHYKEPPVAVRDGNTAAGGNWVNFIIYLETKNTSFLPDESSEIKYPVRPGENKRMGKRGR